LYNCSHQLRLLHSFPTRRSSDLVCGKLERSRIQEILLKNEISDGDLSLVFSFIREHKGLDYTRDKCVELIEGAKAELKDLPESEDRKSTRLNSSHRTISYAVFCL